ncbi:DUF883 family protein [Nitrococcus mobilis]|uniref:Uncharacterized protein n=1 Tax=Nitrococcus mobilis Nb-231 TaxID=314278 RepID=A4BUZ9_9GAMM|nr:DUF883 family protein [Nitrococcus mobilis]EAR20420.1 hypothetical protein NB231_13866 [Nitrococcus mobilis Nb-231]
MATKNVPPTNTHHTTDHFAKVAHEAVDRAARHGAQAEEHLREAGDHYSEQSRQAIDWMTRYIHEHPYAALGWAVAGGFVLGKLLRSR